MFECSCQAYRDGDAPLSRAAEIAGLSLRDLILKMKYSDMELNCGVAELEKDLRE